MSDKLHLKITTHEKVIFDSYADEITLRGAQGEFGVLPGHIPFMTTLDIGVGKVILDGKEQLITVMGGIFQLKDNEALILTQSAENAQDIDVERANAAKKRAEQRLKEKSAEIDAQRAEIALAKAMARLKATSK